MKLKLNARMKDSQREAFLMSEELVNGLVQEVIEHIGKTYEFRKRLFTAHVTGRLKAVGCQRACIQFPRP